MAYFFCILSQSVSTMSTTKKQNLCFRYTKAMVSTLKTYGFDLQKLWFQCSKTMVLAHENYGFVTWQLFLCEYALHSYSPMMVFEKNTAVQPISFTIK